MEDTSMTKPPLDPKDYWNWTQEERDAAFLRMADQAVYNLNHLPPKEDFSNQTVPLNERDNAADRVGGQELP
jgi:hypothetical protein